MANILVYCNVDRLERTERKDGALYDPENGTYQIMGKGVFEACKTGVPIEEGGRPPIASTYNYPVPGAVSYQRLQHCSRTITEKKFIQLTVIEFCKWYLDEVKDVRIVYT